MTIYLRISHTVLLRQEVDIFDIKQLTTYYKRRTRGIDKNVPNWRSSPVLSYISNLFDIFHFEILLL